MVLADYGTTTGYGRLTHRIAELQLCCDCFLYLDAININDRQDLVVVSDSYCSLKHLPSK